jgi:hypothetical protein
MAGDADIAKLTDDLVVLSIQVVGDVAGNFPAYAQKILGDPAVQRQLTDELTKLAQKRFEAASGAPSKDKPEDQAGAFVKKAGEILKPAALDELKKIPAVQDLLKKAGQLGDALKKTPVGVWVDEHDTVVYLVAAGAALSGVVALYALHTGDVVTDTLLPLLDNKQVKWQGYTFGVTSLRLEPSKGGGELKGFVTKSWKKVEVKLDLMGKVVGGHVKAVGGGVQVIVPVEDAKVTASATATANTDGTGSLGIGVSVEKGKLKIDVLAEARKLALPKGPGPAGGPALPNYGLSAKAGVSGEVAPNVRLGVEGNVGTAPPGGTQWGVLGTVTITLDPVKK